ncbi:MAG: TAXI family TRAP transporter solute-binding subunit [Thermus sp.]|jgi:TRAP transporter TAXI family solute receptor|nr:TAXI family TRAP transporter solute-binding subunit [Thermus sp.]MDT7909600.1 TAXI family TRAP transporter solute-binding subunit [Thermus sp.]MDT7922220.1 TAXI family TRAP transporter solute-binding subunit [Thermus sp.]
MRMKRMVLAALAFLGLGLAQEFITIGSGSTTGVYFPVATGMAKLVNEANVGIRANARSTGGSVANINAIAAGEFEMALAQNDISYYAYQGCCIPAFDGKPVKVIRALAALYPEVVHIVARADAGIRTVADLKGKRVVVGDVGSGTEQNARQILEAYGLRFEDLGQAIRVSATQGIQLMQDKRADALFYTVGLGASAIQQLALTTPITLVAVDLGKVQAIAKKYPFYVGFNIPGGTYKGVDVTTPTVAVQAMLIASEKLSADTVYKFMKAVFGNQEAFKKIHPNLERFFSLQRAVKGLPIPLHPGAERFYKEVGVLK